MFKILCVLYVVFLRIKLSLLTSTLLASTLLTMGDTVDEYVESLKPKNLERLMKLLDEDDEMLMLIVDDEPDDIPQSFAEANTQINEKEVFIINN